MVFLFPKIGSCGIQKLIVYKKTLIDSVNSYFIFAKGNHFMMHLIKQPWPWYIAGPLIGLMVPLLLIVGNKSFGISSTLRHVCAACFPSDIPFFKYDWKKEAWNLFFAAGILIGAFIAWSWLSNHQVTINNKLAGELTTYGISDFKQIVPTEVVSWSGLFTLRLAETS